MRACATAVCELGAGGSKLGVLLMRRTEGSGVLVAVDSCILAPNRLASIGLIALSSVVAAEDALLLGVLWLGAQSGLKFPVSREVRLGASVSPAGSGASSELTSIVNMQRNGERESVCGSITGCVFSGHVLAVVGTAHKSGVILNALRGVYDISSSPVSNIVRKPSTGSVGSVLGPLVLERDMAPWPWIKQSIPVCCVSNSTFLPSSFHTPLFSTSIRRRERNVLRRPPRGRRTRWGPKGKEIYVCTAGPIYCLLGGKKSAARFRWNLATEYVWYSTFATGISLFQI
jgi:hypothetical protein